MCRCLLRQPALSSLIETTRQAGTIGINKYLPDPAAPFGGVKASGLGRELGPNAITAYQQLKSIYT